MIRFNGIAIENAKKILQNGTLLYEEAVIPPVSSYVQDGLVFLLDGIEKGNVEGAWTDLIAGRLFTLNNCILNSNNVEFNGVDSYGVDNDHASFPAVPDMYSIEVTMYYEKGCILQGNNRQTSTVGSPMVAFFYSGTNYISIGRKKNYLQRPEGKKDMCLLLFTSDSSNLVYSGGRYNGNVLAKCTNNRLSEIEYLYGNATIGAINTDSNGGKSGFLKGKLYSIRIYNRPLTIDELYHNMLIDYLRFNIDIMDKFNVDLSNDLGEKITEALFAVNDTIINYTGSPIYIPKSNKYFVLFNNIKNHIGPKAIIDLKGNKIQATYKYTGFDGLVLKYKFPTSHQLQLPLYQEVFTSVDWGDGSISSGTIYHSYSKAGTYTVKVSLKEGISKVGINDYDQDYLTEITLFPINVTFTMSNSWYKNLKYVAPLVLTDYLLARPLDGLPGGCNFLDCYSVKSSEYSNNYFSVSTIITTTSSNIPQKIETLILQGTTYFNLIVRTISNLYISPCLCNFRSYKLVNYEYEFKLEQTTPYLTMFDYLKEIRYVEFPSEMFRFFGKSIVWNFLSMRYWGTEDNKISVTNTLINNTVDLISEDQNTLTIELSTNTKALLTEDEIAQITAKGYTIA